MRLEQRLARHDWFYQKALLLATAIGLLLIVLMPKRVLERVQGYLQFRAKRQDLVARLWRKGVIS